MSPASIPNPADAGLLSGDELHGEVAELLPDREALSVLSDPTAMEMPSLLGGAEAPAPGATDPGTAGLASDTASGATETTTHHMPETSPGDPYSPSESASAT